VTPVGAIFDTCACLVMVPFFSSQPWAYLGLLWVRIEKKKMKLKFFDTIIFGPLSVAEGEFQPPPPPPQKKKKKNFKVLKTHFIISIFFFLKKKGGFHNTIPDRPLASIEKVHGCCF
jgi:hypothetical protein